MICFTTFFRILQFLVLNNWKIFPHLQNSFPGMTLSPKSALLATSIFISSISCLHVLTTHPGMSSFFNTQSYVRTAAKKRHFRSLYNTYHWRYYMPKSPRSCPIPSTVSWHHSRGTFPGMWARLSWKKICHMDGFPMPKLPFRTIIV